MRWKNKRFWAETLQAYIFLLPTLAVLGVFTFFPFVNAFIYSGYDIKTRTVPGSVLFAITTDVESLIASLRRGRVPETLARVLEGHGAQTEHLWVRLREANRWVIRDEKNMQEYLILHEEGALVVRSTVTKWDMQPVGLENFRKVLADPDFVKALRNTAVYVGISVPITLFLALILATLLKQVTFGRSFFRLVNFSPYVTSVVAITMVWHWIFDRHAGLLNYVISTLGSFFGAKVAFVDWLGDPSLALPAVIILSVWRFVGYQAIILLAGMQSIDREYYEAAKVDGGSGLQVWWHITLPLLTPQIFFVFIISVIGAFRLFQEVLILFQGPGPEKSVLTLVYYLYEKAFGLGQYGLASAASVILFAIVFLLSLFNLTVVQRRVHYER